MGACGFGKKSGSEKNSAYRVGRGDGRGSEAAVVVRVNFRGGFFRGFVCAVFPLGRRDRFYCGQCICLIWSARFVFIGRPVVFALSVCVFCCCCCVCCCLIASVC